MNGVKGRVQNHHRLLCSRVCWAVLVLTSACGGENTDSARRSEPATSHQSAAASTGRGRSAAEPPEPVHGLKVNRSYWAAYFAVETAGNLVAGERSVAEATVLLRSFGLRPMLRNPRCDAGALAALDLDPEVKHRTVATYFHLRAQAERIARSVDYLPAVTVERVAIRCR